jgi:hypothetical protein
MKGKRPNPKAVKDLRSRLQQDMIRLPSEEKAEKGRTLLREEAQDKSFYELLLKSFKILAPAWGRSPGDIQGLFYDLKEHRTPGITLEDALRREFSDCPLRTTYPYSGETVKPAELITSLPKTGLWAYAELLFQQIWCDSLIIPFKCARKGIWVVTTLTITNLESRQTEPRICLPLPRKTSLVWIMPAELLVEDLT